MSSRNVRLTPAGPRDCAGALCRDHARAPRISAPGSPTAWRSAKPPRRCCDAGFERVEYIELRDADTLMPSDDPTRPRRMLAAAWLDGVRLIDNIPV